MVVGRGSWVVGRGSWVQVVSRGCTLCELILISRFVLMCREFFWPVENFFHRSRIYFLVANFLAGRECFFFLFRDNLIGECRG